MRENDNIIRFETCPEARETPTNSVLGATGENIGPSSGRANCIDCCCVPVESRGAGGAANLPPEAGIPAIAAAQPVAHDSPDCLPGVLNMEDGIGDGSYF